MTLISLKTEAIYQCDGCQIKVDSQRYGGLPENWQTAEISFEKKRSTELHICRECYLTIWKQGKSLLGLWQRSWGFKR